MDTNIFIKNLCFIAGVAVSQNKETLLKIKENLGTTKFESLHSIPNKELADKLYDIGFNVALELFESLSHLIMVDMKGHVEGGYNNVSLQVLKDRDIHESLCSEYCADKVAIDFSELVFQIYNGSKSLSEMKYPEPLTDMRTYRDGNFRFGHFTNCKQCNEKIVLQFNPSKLLISPAKSFYRLNGVAIRKNVTNCPS